MKTSSKNIFSLILILFSVFIISGFLSINTSLAFYDESSHYRSISQTPPGGGGSIDPPSNNLGGGGPIDGSNVSINLVNPFSGADSLFELLKKVMNDIVLPIGGVLAVLAFIYSGFLYVTAQGSEDKLKTAHRALLYTSIGTAVLLGSWVLANVICETIGQLGGPACST